MAITRVQGTTGKNTTFASSVVSTAFGSTVTAGNYLILAWEGDANLVNSANTPTDNKGGNTWIKASSHANSNSGIFDLEIWYAKVVNGGTGMTVTVTDTGGGVDSTLIVEEWSGIAAVTPLDGHHEADDNSTAGGTFDSGAITTTNANDVIWVAACQSIGTATFTAGTNFSNKIQTNTTFTTIGAASRVVAATAAYHGLITSSVTNQAWNCSVIALADTAVSSGGISPSSSLSPSSSRSPSSSASPSISPSASISPSSSISASVSPSASLSPSQGSTTSGINYLAPHHFIVGDGMSRSDTAF